ncbi:hypothetical protein [Clostridium sp. KNHs216]|uniref:hypothetical protein n=1 Tax=Clostridium sp. KNHs216 TaxID=1550235 RepID=UPI0016397D28|nr:hypothetical protein [Clostridium sp. KNHs216]
MNCYKEMYYQLFNRVSNVIEELKDIQKETEEIYMAQSDFPKVMPLNPKDKNINP